MQTTSIHPINSFDEQMLSSFVIITQPSTSKTLHNGLVNYDGIMTEIQNSIDVMNILMNVGNQKLETKYFGDAKVLFKFIISMGNNVLENIENYEKTITGLVYNSEINLCTIQIKILINTCKEKIGGCLSDNTSDISPEKLIHRLANSYMKQGSVEETIEKYEDAIEHYRLCIGLIRSII